MRSSFRLALFALLSISVINIFSATMAMKYRVVSADGHEVSDLITFSIDTPIGIDVTPQSEPFVLPLPIVLAIALLIIVGGFFALERRRRAD
jgi:hypothetical protein